MEKSYARNLPWTIIEIKKTPNENFYEGTWGCSLLFKASTKYNQKKTQQDGMNEWWCNNQEDGNHIRENILHITIECGAYENERQDLINRINERIGMNEYEISDRSRAPEGHKAQFLKRLRMHG